MSLGVSGLFIRTSRNIPGICFTGDAGMVYNGKFLCSNFRHRERQPEIEHYIKWMKANDYEIYHVPDHVYFEGLGDVVQFGRNYS